MEWDNSGLGNPILVGRQAVHSTPLLQDGIFYALPGYSPLSRVFDIRTFATLKVSKERIDSCTGTVYIALAFTWVRGVGTGAKWR